MGAVETPFDDVLGRVLSRDVLLGKEAFRPAEALAAMDLRQKVDFKYALVDVAEGIQILADPGSCRAQSRPGEIVSYVPDGLSLERRVVSAGLYSDRVVVNPPFETYHLLLSEPGRNRAIEQWLRFVWAVRQPVTEGWLEIAKLVFVANDNLDMLSLDEEFWGSLSSCYRNTFSQVRDSAPESMGIAELEAHLAYEYLFNAAYLATYFGTPRVLMFPPDRFSAAVFEVTAKYFRVQDIPHFLNPSKDDFRPPPRQAPSPSKGELLRGQWFDELLVGLGPVAGQLDSAAVCMLRSSGVAAELQRFLATDLNELAFSYGDTGAFTEAMQESRRRLQQIASQVNAAVAASHSATVRERLRVGAISAMSGVASGFLDTAVSHGPMAVAAATAGIGFALGVVAGATGVTKDKAATAYPFLIDVMKAAPANRRKGS